MINSTKRCFIIVFVLFGISCSLPVSSVWCFSKPYIASHEINFAVGNKFHKDTDIIIEGPVSPLSFTRYYNSRSEKENDLGYGWSHSFAEKLSVTPSVTTYTRPDGRAVDFIYDSGSSSWVKESDKTDTITEETDGYHLKESTGTTKIFDLTTGKIKKHKDRSGNTTVTFSYSTGQTDIVDNFGRSLSLIFDWNERLQTLSTPVGDFTYTYSSNNLDKVCRPGSITICKQYSYIGNDITGMTNEEGDPLFTVGYAMGRVTSSSLQGGMNPITISYPSEDEVIVKDATTQETTTYNLIFKHGIARVGSFVGPECSNCGTDSGSYVYSDRLQIETSTDANNIVTEYGYDANGNRENTTKAKNSPLERTTTISHNLITNLPTSISRDTVGSCSNLNAVETWVYDLNNNPDYKEETGCAGTTDISRTTEYTYDSKGRIEYFNGPRSDAGIGKDDITYTYYPDTGTQGNKQGMLHTVTNGLGHTTEYLTYNALRKPTLIEDANGIQTTLDYNDFGQLTESTVGTRSTTYEYDNAGVLQIIHLPENRNLVHEHYTNGKVWKITDNSGNNIEYFYDGLGNSEGRDINNSSGSLTATIGYLHDIKGRLHKTYDGIGSDINKPSEELKYDGAGNLVERIVLKDYDTDTYLSTSYAYDDLRRLWKIQNPGSSTDNVILGYDDHDNQTTVIDNNNVTTALKFDDFGRKISEEITENGADNLIATYEYDLADNLTKKIDGNSKTIEYSYDALSRLTDIVFTDSTQDVEYTYDEIINSLRNKGRLTSMNDGSGSSSYNYNIHNELTKETRITNEHTFVTEYGYNGNGDLISIIYPSGRKITYNRTGIGQIFSIDSLYDGTTGRMADYISSQPFGPIQRMILGNGKWVDNSYDTLYRLRTATVSGIHNRSYTYWSNGQLDTITDSIDSNNGQSFTYDDLGHIDTATGSYGFLNYNHDGVGNRTRFIGPAGTTGYSYFTGSNRLSQVNASTTANYSYDNIGNINTISQESTAFDWTDDYMLKSAMKNNATVGSYKYDGNGLRTIKTAGGETTFFVYDKDGNLSAEANSQGNVLKEYVYVNGKIFAHFQYSPPTLTVISQSSTAATVAGGAGEVAKVFKNVGRNAFYQEPEVRGSSSSIASSTPSEVASFLVPIYLLLIMGENVQLPAAEGAYYYTNDHLGTPQIIIDDAGVVAWKGIYSPFGDVEIVAGNTVENNIRFPGQYYDDETGLHYNHHRYYDPSIGRYISADPIGLAGGLNLYSYVGNDPVNYIDPSGLNPALIIQAENFVLMYGPEITAAVESLFPHMPANHYVGQLYSSVPEITNGLLQANQTLGQCIVDSADYLANQALHDLINGAIPSVLDGISNEWNQATKPPKPQNLQLYFQQGPLK